MRWEAGILRTYFAFSFTDQPLTKTDIVKILASQVKKISSEQQRIVRYKEALDYIYWEFLSSQKTLGIKAVYDIYDTISTSGGRLEEGKVRRLLDYLSTSPDHPVIQAGIVHEEIQNEPLRFLLTLLFLYNRGYDFRGLLVLEEYFRKNIVPYREVLSIANQTRNLTLWLEFFAEGIINQLEEALKDIENLSYKTTLPAAFFNLNDRQKHILTFLEEPGSRITNKKVQNIFNISQITASRDLAHLKTLGLLISHGKGRSVYYTRSN